MALTELERPRHVRANEAPLQRRPRHVRANEAPLQRRPRDRKPLVRAGAFAALWCSVAAVLYLVSLHASPPGSDGASVALEGASLAHGNVFLHSWDLSLDSFWTVDVLFYSLGYLVLGMRPILMDLVPALIAACVVVVGALAAREGRRGVGALVGAGTVVTILALPTHALALYYLKGPYHVGTALFALAAFVCLRRARFGLAWAAAVAFLAAGMLGDLMEVAYGVVPVLLAGLVSMARERRLRRGAVVSAAALASVVLALAVHLLSVSVSGFTIAPANPRATAHQMYLNIRGAFALSARLIGPLSSLYGTGGVPSFFQDVRAAAAATLALGFLAGLVSLLVGLAKGSRSEAAPGVPPLWRLDDMLLIATVGPAVTFVVLALSLSTAWGRYLTASFIFSAVLAGRFAGRLYDWLRARLARAALVSAGLAVAACMAAGVGFTLRDKVPSQPATVLGSWLVAHHFKVGLADYWSSNITTVETSAMVLVRPVHADHGAIAEVMRNAERSWYKGVHFQFFAYNTHRPFARAYSTSAIATWGPPAHEYHVGDFEVLTWPTAITTHRPHPGSSRSADSRRIARAWASQGTTRDRTGQ
ncbi:MAG: hypothetical protein ACYDGN_04310 [Acidimicrobiales bacterium]